MELKPGGIWRLTMHGPDGADYPSESVFTEVVKPERIVFTLRGGKKEAPETHIEMTWTFEDQGGMTRITVRQVYPTAEERDYVAKNYGAIEGAKQTMGRLAEFLNP
jgi:uncharacterized protein YndB with AHSA1/START domain